MGQKITKLEEKGGDTEEGNTWPKHYGPPPMPGLHGFKAPEVSTDPKESTLGDYIRLEILYFFTHVMECNRRWAAHWTKIHTHFNQATDKSRKMFWSRCNTNQMLDEMQYMRALERDIGWACGELSKVQYANGQCTAHSNLSARSEYYLRLVIPAITDLRMMEDHNDVNITHGGPGPLHLVANMGYNAGLNMQSQVCTYLNITNPWMFKHATQAFMPKLKVPAHFTELMDKLKGPGWSLKPRLMMYLLVRYAMFLSFLLWMPDLYDQNLTNSWYDPMTVLYLDRSPGVQDYNYLETSMTNHPWITGENKDVRDVEVIVGETDGPQNWTDVNGVRADDNTTQPPRRDRFDSFIEHDATHDKRRCEETAMGYCSRLCRE